MQMLLYSNITVLYEVDFIGCVYFNVSNCSCEADPGALAKYVVALVKKDKPRDELKGCCLGQLEVFLQTSQSLYLYFLIPKKTC